VFSYLPFFLSEFDKEFDRASDKNRFLGKKRIKLEFITDAIFLFYSLFAFLILFYSYLKNQITIGLFISVTGYMLTLLGTISGAIGTIENITKYNIFKKDYLSFIQNSISNAIADQANTLQDNVVLMLRDLQFKYPGSNKLILNDISFSFKCGKKYAIVGVNGSGKTTLAKIMTGLYSPCFGTIISNCTPVVLFQDFNRYPVTLKENITLSETHISEDKKKIADIEEKSGLKKRINKMKHGDNTELTTLKEEGEELSGGEWQRVALARILYSDADIYILDEPTANLDPIEEIRIFEAYNELLKDKTVIYITHRLGFVKNVDEVIVLNDGKIAEIGTHENLIKQKNSIYKNMFEEQRIWYK
jgi:ATP-binding cassette subfamily B protein